MAIDETRLAKLRGLAGELAVVELWAWVSLALLTACVTATTLMSSFPARTASLVGEAAVLLVCAGLAGWAGYRPRRLEEADAGRLAVAGVLAIGRLVLLGPLLLFFLIVAAAGYTA